MHTQRHPRSGKYFRVLLNYEDIQAIEDTFVNGSVFKLIDWADRLPQDSEFSTRQKEVACMFYAHRCQPELPPSDPVPISALKLSDVVYGICSIEYEGRAKDQLTLLKESELLEAD